MENLPSEMVEEICRHLSVQDLISCCAVSTDWRTIFGRDSLWKPHCRQDLEEYLRITPCTVEPAFVSPEPESSSLTSISQWRLAYMRQNHLWNNWRTGNLHSKVLECHTTLQADGFETETETFEWKFRVEFLKEHYLAKIYDDRIEIWDLREDRAIKVVDISHYFPNIETFLCIPSGSSMIVFRHETGVQVFELELESKSIGLKHAFYFNESKKLPEVTPELARNMFQRKYPPHIVFVETVGNLFVGVYLTSTGNSLLHVWDLENGIKRREEISPKSGTLIIGVKGSVNSDDLLVTCGSLSESRKISKKGLCGYYYYCIYSLKQLAFYSFNKVVTDGTVGALNKNCLLCYNGQTLTIYNFKRAELIVKISFELSLIDEIDFGFFLMDLKSVLHTFDTLSFDWKHFKLEKLRPYKRLCGNFLMVEYYGPFIPTYAFEIGNRTKITQTLLADINDTVKSNQTCTRVVIKENRCGYVFFMTVINFW
ncbi:hypothetical protein J6590_033225 [Homalodisca vitripennis]|nr:hypothetical protein J6590_033225 [Homalodisca vitripennis]